MVVDFHSGAAKNEPPGGRPSRISPSYKMTGQARRSPVGRLGEVAGRVHLFHHKCLCCRNLRQSTRIHTLREGGDTLDALGGGWVFWWRWGPSRPCRLADTRRRSAKRATAKGFGMLVCARDGDEDVDQIAWRRSNPQPCLQNNGQHSRSFRGLREFPHPSILHDISPGYVLNSATEK